MSWPILSKRIGRYGCLALTAAALLTAGCGQEEAGLTVWGWHPHDPSTELGKWLMKIDRDFKATHPDAGQVYEVQSHNEYYQIFKPAASAATGPDVVMLHQGSRILVHRDVLLPLTEFVTPELRAKVTGWDLTSENFDANGTPYAVPIAVQGLVWYYNKTVLKEAGLDPENAPPTWEEFLAACAAVKNIGKAGIAVGEQEGDWAEWFVNSAGLQALTPEDQTHLATGELKWTDPKVAEIFVRLKELNDKGCFQKGFLATKLWRDAIDLFRRGDAAFFLGLISDVAHWKEFGDHFGPENIGVMPCPVFKPGPGAGKIPVGGAFAYGITRWAKNPKLAFEYIASVVSDANAKTFFTRVGSFPANYKLNPALITDPSAKTIAGWLESGRTGPQFTSKLPTQVSDTIKPECQRLLSGQTDVAGATAAIEKAAAAARARAKAVAGDTRN